MKFGTISKLIIGAAITVPVIAHALATPQIEFLLLNDPVVSAVRVTIPQSRLFSFGTPVGKYTSVKRWDFRVGADVLHPFEFHPQGRANATAGIGSNYGLDFARSTYVGSIFGMVGVESSLDTNRKYRAQNYTYSAGIEQEIPGTDFLKVVMPSAAPAVISIAVSQVEYAITKQKSDVRADGALSWTIPLPLGTKWVTTGSGHWAKDVKPYAYVESGASYPIPMQPGFSIPGLQPMIFARFVSGAYPPNYHLVNTWEYGISTGLAIPGLGKSGVKK